MLRSEPPSNGSLTWKILELEIGRTYLGNSTTNTSTTEVDVMRRDLETTKQEPKESFSAFITKWRSKVAQMMNKPNEEEQLTMVVKNLLPIYH